MITYDWTFPQFVIEPSLDGLTNVVTAMVWCCTGVDDLDGTTALESGRVQLKPPTPAQFIPFDQITEALALSWLDAYISMPGVEKQIARRITDMRQPVQPINPPFAASST